MASDSAGLERKDHAERVASKENKVHTKVAHLSGAPQIGAIGAPWARRVGILFWFPLTAHGGARHSLSIINKKRELA
jgi:uncharacterized membrane protein